MTKTRLSLPVAGLLLAFALTLFVGYCGEAARAESLTSGTQAFETPLHQDGYPLEINQDPAGFLWVTDYEVDLTGQGEVWQVDPTTNAYTLYHGMNAPSDARGDGAGTLWWADFDNKRIGRLASGETEAELWQLGGSSGLYGTALDASDHFWVADSGESQLHSLDPADNTLCAYEFPSSGTAGYLAVSDDALWFADGYDEYLYRLSPGGPALTQWPLPAVAYPEGLAVDSSGSVWWADPVLEALLRLDPDRGELTTFTLPPGSTPEMVATAGERVWFSEVWEYGAIGFLDPWQASGDVQTLAHATVPVTATCAIHTPDLTLSLSVTQGTLPWTETTYPTITLGTGIWAATLPDFPFPWGVAADGNGTWAVDTDRRLLVRLPARPADVRACAVDDEDGNLATWDDRTPLVGWTVSLFVDGVEQVPGQSTGQDGCYTWTGLDAGVPYGVGQTLEENWTALTANAHAFGPAASGGGYRYVFINTRSVMKVFLPVVLR